MRAARAETVGNKPQKKLSHNGASKKLRGRPRTNIKEKPETQAKLLKGRVKEKAVKSRAKAKAQCEDADEDLAGDVPTKLKVKTKLNLKAAIMQELAERDVEVVLEEAKANIEACMQEVAAILEEENSFGAKLEASKATVKEAHKNVEEAVCFETAALEEFKAALLKEGQSEASALQAEIEKGECENLLHILEFKVEALSSINALEETKKAAAEAAESARKSMEESKRKEKEITEELKASLAQQRVNETKQFKQYSDADRASAEIRKQKTAAEKAAQKEATNEVVALEKAMIQREKNRLNKRFEAAKLKGGARRLPTSDASLVNSTPVKRPAPSDADVPITKAAKPVD